MKFQDNSFKCQNRIYAFDYDYGARGINFQKYNLISMGKRSYIVDSEVECILPASILIGHYVSIANDVKFCININHDYLSVSNYPFYIINDKFSNPLKNDKMVKQNKCQILVGNDVWIGRGVTILGGVTIGNGAIVAAGSIVTKDVAPYTIVGGNPAKFIKYRFSQEIGCKLDIIKWWQWDEEKIISNRDLMDDVELFVKKHFAPIEVDDNEVTRWLSQQRKEGKNMFFLPMDLADNYPVWENILDDYCNTYQGRNDALLLLGLLPSDESHMDSVTEILHSKVNKDDKKALFKIIKMNDAFSKDILQEVDYFITTKSIVCLPYIDYAQQSNVKILSGINKYPFSEVVFE